VAAAEQRGGGPASEHEEDGGLTAGPLAGARTHHVSFAAASSTAQGNHYVIPRSASLGLDLSHH
jgi:hypothetical protein